MPFDSFYFRFRDSYFLVVKEGNKRVVYRIFEKEIFELFKALLEENEEKFKSLFKIYLNVVKDASLLKRLVEEYTIKRLKYNEIILLYEEYLQAISFDIKENKDDIKENKEEVRKEVIEDFGGYTAVYIPKFVIHDFIKRFKKLIVKIEERGDGYIVYLKYVKRMKENVESYLKILDLWIKEIKEELKKKEETKT